MFVFMKIMFFIVPLLALSIITFVILNIISPKFNGKMMSRQVKSIKHMMDYSKDDIKDINDIAYNTRKEVLDDNEDVIRGIVNKEADIESDAIRKKTKAFKDGLTDSKYCKYCGTSIDEDSLYCKKCGKKLS